MNKYLITLLLVTGCAFTALAQKPDTAKTVVVKSKDTIHSTTRDTVAFRSLVPRVRKERVFHPDSTHSPHVAIVRSIIIPGWGQLYNHRWWKVPIIYGGLGLFGVAIVFNQRNYSEFSTLALYYNHGIVPTEKDNYYKEYNIYKANNVPAQSIYDAADGYRRNRDLCYLGVVAFWGINVIDAYIDAKFIHSFTVDNNLSMKVRPDLITQPVYAQNLNASYIPGIKIIFTLK